MKKNGFCCPFALQQVLSWIFLLITASCFYIFTAVFFTDRYRSLILTGYSVSLIIVIIIGFLATISDPSDPFLKKELSKKEKCEKDNTPYTLEVLQNLDICIICCSNVTFNAKHCKQCDRCVDNFDHHCGWLNNCIGAQNYKLFISLLIIVCFNSGIDICFKISALMVYFNKNDNEFELINKNCSNIGISVLSAMIITFIFCIFNFLILLNVSYLISVHIWLRCQGLTTYEYIVRNNKDENIQNVEKLRISKLSDSKLGINNNQVQNQNNISNSQKKAKNKILPTEFIDRFDDIELKKNKIKIDNGKIFFEDKDFKSKVFQPIIDDLYNIKKIDNTLMYLKNEGKELDFNNKVYKNQIFELENNMTLGSKFPNPNESKKQQNNEKFDFKVNDN